MGIETKDTVDNNKHQDEENSDSENEVYVE